MNQQQDQLMFLIVLNRDDQRRSKAWLRFDIIVSDRRITIFVDFKISHCFIVRRIVDLLKLKLQHIFEKLLRKDAETFLYVIRDEESILELTFIQQTIDNSKLNKALSFDLLNVFRNDLSNASPSLWSQNHSIDNDDAKSINKSSYELFKKQLNEQDTQIDYLLKRELVRSSTSLWEASVLFAKKKNEEWRMCIDYRALNAMTLKNDYSLSRIQNCLDMIETTRSFNKIDLTSEYWQINVVERDRHKTTFNIKRDKYEFCVMFFELTNASITFQTMMNEMLRSYLDKFVIIYLNDILIYFKNDEKHSQHVKLIVKALRTNDFYVKSSKCVFYQKRIEFCDHIIDNEEIRMNETKLKIIRDWSSLQTVHDVRSFLELCAYYRRFIENFVILTSSFYELIQKAKEKKFKQIHMNFFARNAFQAIKNAMCNDRVLAQSNISFLFIIEIDVFDFEWEIVLYQAGLDNIKRSIAFESKTFTSTKRNYATHERELLIIKKNLRKWKCYVKNDITTIVRTNHAKLQHLRTIVKSSERLARWLVEFEKYKLNIRYKFDSKMTILDALNRRSDYQLRILNANLRTITFDETVITYARDKSLSSETKWDVELKKYENQLKLNRDDRVFHRDDANDNWVSYTKLWTRANFLNVTHKNYEHCSKTIMYDIIRVKQWWFDMRNDIRHFVRHCSKCQLIVKSREIKKDVMHSSNTWVDRNNSFER